MPGRSSGQSLLQDARFDLTGFYRRWTGARRAAFRSVSSESADTALSEEELLQGIAPERRDELLRAVFERSRALGLGLSRHLGLTLERDDFEELLGQSGIRCFSGFWDRRATANVLRRPGCGLTPGDSFPCSYWREAVDGLVIGAGAEERFTRHGNVLFGDPECVDVLYVEDGARAGVSGLGPIPPRLAPALPKIQTLFHSVYRMELQFPGYADGTLYYLIKGGGGTACGPGARLLEQTLCRKLAALQPGLCVQDASPKMILGGTE